MEILIKMEIKNGDQNGNFERSKWKW